MFARQRAEKVARHIIDIFPKNDNPMVGCWIGGTLAQDGTKIGCNEGCIGNLIRTRRLSCAVNPAVGKEKQYRIQPTTSPKRIAIGGGPAGSDASRIAALKWHKVTLYEKNDQLGGQLLVASIPKFKYELKAFGEYLIG